MRVHEVAEQLGISTSTVRKLVREGRLECSRNGVNERYFTQENIDDFLGYKHEESLVFYVRSSSGDKDLIQSQINDLTQAYGQPLKVYKDSASGLNEKRPGLAKLLKDSRKGKYNTLAITYEDRLARFGVPYIKEILDRDNVDLKILHESVKYSQEEELMADFMSLITSFSGRFYRLRSKEAKQKLLKQAGDNLA